MARLGGAGHVTAWNGAARPGEAGIGAAGKCKMQPRPYQQTVIDSVESAFVQFNRALVVLPTGGGKTIVFSHIAQRQPGRTLILAHREELIDQAIAKLHAATGIIAEKEKADDYASMNAHVVVASIQTMMRRADRWPQDHFSLVVCDEAHHSISDSWSGVLSRFDGHAKVLGVTATPDRGDARELGTYYQTIAAEVSLGELIRDGYLSPIIVKMLPLTIDLSGVKQVAGDYDAAALGDALVPYLRSIAHCIRDHASFRRTLCFLPLIHTSKMFVDTCNSIGLKAAHVDGTSEDRAEILARFARGEFDILSNAMLLTEGYDVDSAPTGVGIDCVCVLRPTRSRPLYAQMVGRGTRIAPLKENLLLLDFLWSSQRHSLSRPAHLVAKSESEAEVITALAVEKSISGGESQESLDIEGLASEAAEQRHAALRKKLDEHRNKKAKSISAAEFAASLNDSELMDYEPVMQWESEAISDKQSKVLKRAHIDVKTVLGRGHASKLISHIMRNQPITPASVAQKAMMKRMGCEHWETATSADARKFFAGMRNK